jgi:uncharacterized delta-60 repeat protein
MHPNPSTSTTRTLLSLAIGLALSANLTTTLAAPGALDTSFSTDGVQFNDVSGHDEGRAMAVQADGKILIGGYSNTAAPRFFGLLRYNADGTLDTSFSGDGIGGTYLPSQVSPTDSIATALAIQADGKILQAGYSGGDFALVRYNSSNGGLDTTFGGGDGIVITDLGGMDVATAMVIQADGKILLAGYTDYGFDNNFALARYNSDGTLDTSFDGDGKLVEVYDSSVDLAYALAVQADGKILLAGSTAYYDQQTNEPPYIHLRRYNSNGTLDTTFGTNGLVADYTHQAGSEAYTLAVQPDGKILLAGYGDNGSNREMVVLRYLSTGALDTGFGTAGKITGPISYDGARTLALQPDGKILMGGDIATYNGISETWDFALARYNSNGTADTGFGAGGDYLVSFDISGSDDHAYGMALQPDGKIVLGGSLFNGSDDDYAVLRVIASDTAWDLTPDNFLFSSAGTVAPSTVQFSAIVNLAGLDTGVSVPVSISGGEYGFGSGVFTSNPGYIENGRPISVRHTASATGGAINNTVLTIGGLHATNSIATTLGTAIHITYTSTTAMDTSPDAFSFTDQTGVAQSTAITSAPITIAGIAAAASISVSNGEYSLDGINFVSTDGTVNNGDSITLRHTSASAASTSVNTILTIGGVTDTFTSTTAAAAGGGGGGGALSWPSLLLMGLPLLRHRRRSHDSTAR